MSETTIVDANRDRGIPPGAGQHARLNVAAHLKPDFAEIEGEPIPIDHVDLLLALRRKEREVQRSEP